MVKKTINHYLVFTAIFNLASSATFVTYALFLKSHGLNYLQINLVNFVFMLCVTLLELPTGIFADLFGRRYSLLWGCLLFVPSNLIYYFSKSFGGFICAEICGALAVTFMSGALDAWLKDSLDYHGFQGNLAEVFSKSEIVRNAMIIGGSLTGSYIAQFNLAIPWLLAACGALLSALYLRFFFQEQYFCRKNLTWATGWQKIKSHLKESLSVPLGNKLIILLISVDFGLILAYQAPNMFWTIVLEKYLHNTFTIGKVWAFIPVVCLIGAYCGGKLSNIFSSKKIIGLNILVIGLCLLIASRAGSVYMVVIFFAAHECGRGMMGPVRRAYINKHLPAKERATILSFDSMISHLGAALGLLISGLIAKSYSIESAWLVSSILIIWQFSLVILLPNGKKPIKTLTY